jgi:hypothetical protein
MGVQIGVPLTHQPMASLHKVTRFLLGPFDHLGICITPVSMAFKFLHQKPKDVTVLVRVVRRMAQHLQGHSVQRVLRGDDDMEIGVCM